MKKFCIGLCIVVIFTFIISSCWLIPGEGSNGDPEEEAIPVAENVIFDIPGAFTGASLAPSEKAITTDTLLTIHDFFHAMRYQIWFADKVAYVIRSMIIVLEQEDIFSQIETFTRILSRSTHSGDVVRWTVGDQDDYTLEWWMLQEDSSFKKYLELQLDEYSGTVEEPVIRGHVIAYIPANPAIALFSGFQNNGDWIKVEFDSDYQDAGIQWMRIYVNEFLAEALDPTQSGLTALYTQKCIFEAERDPSGIVSITGCTYVPGTTHLTYSDSEYENRYYIYAGKGTDSAATIKLGLPLESFERATVFDGRNRIGWVMREWYADYLRQQAVDDPVTNTLNVLVLLGHLTITGSVSAADPENPTTDEIYEALEATYAALPLDSIYLELFENASYLMNVTNPVYFSAGGFVSFGDTVPEGFPAGIELPEMTVTQSEIDGLTIEFAFPGDTPPDPES